MYSQASEQRILWERAFCPLFGGCPYLGSVPHFDLKVMGDSLHLAMKHEIIANMMIETAVTTLKRPSSLKVRQWQPLSRTFASSFT